MHETLEKIRYDMFLDSSFPEEQCQINERISDINDAFAASNFTTQLNVLSFNKFSKSSFKNLLKFTVAHVQPLLFGIPLLII